MADDNENPPENEEADLWSTGFFSFARKETGADTEFREKLRNYDCKLAGYLADIRNDSPAGFCGRADVAELEKLIIQDYGKNDCREPLRLLNKIVFRLNQLLQKSIPPPQRLQLIEKNMSVFFGANAVAHRCVAAWLQAEERWIDSCCPWTRNNTNDAVEPAGTIAWEMVIASAALHCGILDLECAVALMEALADPPSYFACSPIRGYADLFVQAGTQSKYVIKRWYPDDRLLLLMSRVSPESMRAAIANCNTGKAGERTSLIGNLSHRGIIRELNMQRVDPKYHPASFSDVLRMIEQVLRSEIPSVLVDYATGELESRSLFSPSNGRVNGDPTNSAVLKQMCVEVETDEDDAPVPDDPAAYDCENDRQEDPEWLLRLRYAFRYTVKPEIKEALFRMEQGELEMPPVAKQLVSFARNLLENRASTGNKWAVASVKCCILTVARRFGIQTRRSDPATFKTITLQELYHDAIEDAANDSLTPARLQHIVAWALREFQRHLVLKFDGQTVNEAIAFKVPSGLFPVDARIISLDDLFDLIRYIQTTPHEHWLPRYRTYAIAETVLAFLGSLRRMEGLGLEPCDYVRSLTGQLLIRDNANRALKTGNATRAMQLAIFAHPFPELATYVSVLFHDAPEDAASVFEGISEDVIIPIIHEALQKVTGEDGCHLHSLRHSFGHWTFLRLTLAQLDEIPDLFPHLTRTAKWIQASKGLRQLLYANDLVENDHAWAVASLLGHSNPQTVTVPHYVHCLDLLLSVFLKQNSVFGKVEDEQLRKMSGFSKSTAYKKFSPANSTPSPENCASAESIAMPPSAQSLRITKAASFAQDVFRRRFGLDILRHDSFSVQSEPRISWLKVTRDVLYLAETMQMAQPAIAGTVGLDLRTVASIVSRAKEIAELRSPHSTQFLHDMFELPDGDSGTGCDTRSHRPVPPRGEAARQAAISFAATIGEYVSAHPEDSVATLDYIARNLLPEFARVAFLEPNPTMARNCLSLFSELGFPLAQMHGYCCDGTRPETPARAWLQRWGLSWRCHVWNQFGRQRILKIPNQWLVLEPVFTDNGDNGPSANSQMRALRYAFIMAAIRFGH